jgi:RNA polymerase sigma factor (TIGR02999 family)
MEDGITRLLTEARRGDAAASDRVLQLVYGELHRRASGQLRRHGGGGVTLQTTVLVHEAYLKLFEAARLEIEDRRHFFVLAARAMRQVLIDRFRRASAQKRGGSEEALPLEDWDAAVEERGEALLALDRALEKLLVVDERLGRIVEWKFFGGLTENEIAELLGVTDRTVRNDWQRARAWLAAELSDE